jgi:hypothetical protein
MTKNEQIVRKGYEIAEKQDAEGFIATFTPDGEFNNEALGVIYRGRDVAIPLMIFAKAFPTCIENCRRCRSMETRSSSNWRCRAHTGGRWNSLWA